MEESNRAELMAAIKRLSNRQIATLIELLKHMKSLTETERRDPAILARLAQELGCPEEVIHQTFSQE